MMAEGPGESGGWSKTSAQAMVNDGTIKAR